MCSEAQGEERAPCTRSPCCQEGRQGFRPGLPGSRVWALSFQTASTGEATVDCWPRVKEQWLAQEVITVTKKVCEFKAHMGTSPAPKMEEEEETGQQNIRGKRDRAWDQRCQRPLCWGWAPETQAPVAESVGSLRSIISLGTHPAVTQASQEFLLQVHSS